MENVQLISGEYLIYAVEHLHKLPPPSDWIMSYLIESEEVVRDLIDIFDADRYFSKI